MSFDSVSQEINLTRLQILQFLILTKSIFFHEMIHLEMSYMSDENFIGGDIVDIRDPDKSYFKNIVLLKVLSERFHTTEQLKAGDIVKWKNGLKNRNSPEYGEPAIILAVLEEPFYDEKSHLHSNYYYEPLTIVIGYIEDNEMKASHVDVRRLTRF